MKFKDFKYERPDFDSNKSNLVELIKKLAEAKNIDEFRENFEKINVIRRHIQTMSTLAGVRNTIDTRDEFYDKEKEYWDGIEPHYASIDNEMFKILVNAKFDISSVVPESLIKMADYAIKSFDEKIIPLLQEENALCSKHGKLYASAKIEFDGEEYNLSSITKVLQSDDMDTRKRALKAKMAWFKANQEEIDDIYDKMVKVRDKIAKELGFENYIELGYIRMNRLDYDADMVANYRKQVLDEIVPLAQKYYKKQMNRLGLDELKNYNESIEFTTGNPKPKHSPEEMIKRAHKMYTEMSPETGEFFDTMVEQELFDLIAKPGKAGGGYCTGLFDYNVPIIFSNFNGTSGDVDVLTHEAGHAFQAYSTMKNGITIPECSFPTMESAEIHSMGMEFFAHPWMKLFFEEDTNKYYYLHMIHSIKFIPYGVLVDHFQHEVYAHPEMTPAERNEVWMKLEKTYLPHRDYDGIDVLSEGGFWYQQKHIFEMPFYYIDYTLAQICALQFWDRSYTEDPNVWNDYVNICKVGGTKTFLEILKEGNLKSPFEDGTIRKAVSHIEEFIDDLGEL